MIKLVLALGLSLFLFSCNDKQEVVYHDYQTENVIIIMIDGPRYSETWGEPTRANIPKRDSLSAYGLFCTNFRNLGETYTVPGHTAVCTGNYQQIANDGSQLPEYPSIFQAWLRSTSDPYTKCAIISSKEKLHVLSNCLYPSMQNQFRPFFDCGVNGDGTGGNRTDSVTFLRTMQQLNSNQPKLMLVAFKDPDSYGHMSDSVNYINAIRKTDEYVGLIWNYIQNSTHYKNKTTLIVTNDHGRHLNGISTGYSGHGDNCEGCRQIELFAISPDFKQNVVIGTPYNQIDISTTVAELLHFNFSGNKGKVMWDLFKE